MPLNLYRLSLFMFAKIEKVLPLWFEAVCLAPLQIKLNTHAHTLLVSWGFYIYSYVIKPLTCVWAQYV